MKQSTIALLSLALMVSCARSARDRKLIDYLNRTLEIPVDQLPKAIVVISEEGCPTCNRSLADLMRNQTAKASCLFLISAEGRSVNLNGFLEETANVRQDDGTFRELGLFTGSGVIVLRENEIDTLYALQIAAIREQLMRIEQLVDTLE